MKQFIRSHLIRHTSSISRGTPHQIWNSTGMVYLSRIYTKSGDAGDTGLGDGSRVSKATLRIAAIGDVDELNSVLGLAIAQGPPEAALLGSIQNDLFDLGADLCMPQRADEAGSLRMMPGQAERLEKEIDRINERLQPLR